MHTIFFESSSLLSRLSVNLAKFSSSYYELFYYEFILYVIIIPVSISLQSHSYVTQFHPSFCLVCAGDTASDKRPARK